MYTEDNWDEFIKDMHSGNKVHIDEGIFNYFLEVLPPIYMGKVVKLSEGDRRVSFGFAEGEEMITAFWTEKDKDGKIQYYCEQTNVRNAPW